MASEGIEVVIVGYIKKCSEQVFSPSDDGFNVVMMIHIYKIVVIVINVSQYFLCFIILAIPPLSLLVVQTLPYMQK